MSATGGRDPGNTRAWGAHAPTGMAGWIIRICHALPGSSRLWYRLTRLLRGPIKRAPVRAYDVNALGMELRLLNRGNFCEMTALFAPQFYDVPELDWLAAQLADGGNFVDIGGNVGLYSLAMAHRLGSRIQVHTVEPDAELSARMRFNAEHNGLNIHLAPVALSDHEGVATLKIDARQRGQNSLQDGAAGAANTREVPVTTLLALCQSRNLNRIRAMKIDVEGHEPRILGHFFDNAPETLWPEALLIEHVHDDNGLMQRLTDSLGYVEQGRTARNLLLSRAPATTG